MSAMENFALQWEKIVRNGEILFAMDYDKA